MRIISLWWFGKMQTYPNDLESLAVGVDQRLLRDLEANEQFAIGWCGGSQGSWHRAKRAR